MNLAEENYSPLSGSTAWLRKFTWDESARAIGRICMSFQKLEESLSGHIASLVSKDLQLGIIITAELSFRTKASLLRSVFLYRTDSPEVPGALKRLFARMHSAEQRRNTLLHSYWGRTPDDNETLTRFKYTAKSAKGFVHHIEPLHHEDIDAMADEIGAVTSDLSEYMQSTFPALNE
jgi:hypothetical protein